MISSSDNTGYIAVFDSGVGGLTVLHDALEKMPHEDFLYYADSANVPYGSKSSEDIKRLVGEAIEKIMLHPVKAIVIACNTATSIAISDLREKYDIPIVGMEPAIKVAADVDADSKILVVATEVTLKEEKYKDLISRLDLGERVEACALPGLVKLAEDFVLDGPKVKRYLQASLQHLELETYGTIVLGCTHFLYFKKVLEDMLPSHVKIVDGNQGTVNRLHSLISHRSDDNVSKVITLLSGHRVENEIIQPFLRAYTEGKLLLRKLR